MWMITYLYFPGFILTMRQAKLWEDKKKALLVDTAPTVHMHKNPKNLINIGFEYVSGLLNSDRCNWKDAVDLEHYETIGFNVIYPLYLLNIVPFLKAHGIEPLVADRNAGSPRIVVGGAGATNNNNILQDIADEVFFGELDGNVVDKNGWSWMDPLSSHEVIRGKNAVVEIARGCKHRCGFCEYSWVFGGKYREKNIELVKAQIDQCVKKKIRKITLRTSNIGSYSELDELMKHCVKKKVHMHWSDIAVLDADRMIPWIKPMKISMPKTGIESFDEATRRRIGKPFDDEQLEQTMKDIMKNAGMLHIFLIYGLPGDNYEAWFDWIFRLQEIREAQNHPVRVDFSITNFEPCPNTPLADVPLIDFKEKEVFIRKWVETLKKARFYKQEWDVRPGRDYGRLGRSEPSYRMLMEIRTSGPAITDKLVHAMPSGVGRSVSTRQAERFLNYSRKKDES